MFENLNHKRQTFSYTRLDDDEFLLRPVIVKNSEAFTFSKLKKFAESLESNKLILDETHHEIFVKQDNVEINFILSVDENRNCIISITTYSDKRGITYNKLLEVIDEVKALFKGFLVEIPNN